MNAIGCCGARTTRIFRGAPGGPLARTGRLGVRGAGCLAGAPGQMRSCLLQLGGVVDMSERVDR